MNRPNTPSIAELREAADALRQRSVYREKPGKHSEKPEWFIKTIENLYPSAKRIDLFARQARPGWTVWGDEAQPAGSAAVLSQDAAGEMLSVSGEEPRVPVEAGL